MTTITIQDETALGKVLHAWALNLPETELSVRDLIQARVYGEVAAYNERMPAVFNGLVQPSDAEQALNGYRLRQPRRIDPEKQSYLALDAFQKNGFFILVGDRQVSDLDERVRLGENTTVSFIKLTPLVGG